MEGRIQSALISVYNKDSLAPIIEKLQELNVTMYSTGGTRTFIDECGADCIPVEEVTGYPSILGGRVKTLHPKIFGGILARRDHNDDLSQLYQYEIPLFDLVIVDLYPFEETIAKGGSQVDIIEKIDIGGVSLIRAAAKNFNDVLVIPSRNEYRFLKNILDQQSGIGTLAQRKQMMVRAFVITAGYDSAIHRYFSGAISVPLRYGENPHQQGVFHGNLNEVVEQLHGKELSYNNLLDIDAAIALINDFKDPAFAVIKHNNACGLATDPDLLVAWKKALAADPVSAFGGIIISNKTISKGVAEEINKLFFEVLIAPQFEVDALTILKEKKNRILLRSKPFSYSEKQVRSLLNGTLEQGRDVKTVVADDLKTVTEKKPSTSQINDLLFANRIVKHSKSNAIVLVKNNQLLASGVGQTSRIDALQHAIAKAKNFGFDLQGAVMSSDAFFPFDDCVTIAHEAGIAAIIQPGGSLRDADSVNACNKYGMAMVMTGFRHFKH